jgi:hypothetical protein
MELPLEGAACLSCYCFVHVALGWLERLGCAARRTSALPSLAPGGTRELGRKRHLERRSPLRFGEFALSNPRGATTDVQRR